MKRAAIRLLNSLLALGLGALLGLVFIYVFLYEEKTNERNYIIIKYVSSMGDVDMSRYGAVVTGIGKRISFIDSPNKYEIGDTLNPKSYIR